MCKLCKAEKLTKWHYHDEDFWIADDLNNKDFAKRYIVAYIRHGEKPSSEMIEKMRSMVIQIALSEGYSWFCEDWIVSIPDHFHFQLCVKM